MLSAAPEVAGGGRSGGSGGGASRRALGRESVGVVTVTVNSEFRLISHFFLLDSIDRAIGNVSASIYN